MIDMRNRKKFHMLLVIVCVILAMTGCQKKKQEPIISEDDATSLDTELTARPLDEFKFRGEIISPTAIKLKWNKIRRGDSYVITRREWTADYSKKVTFQTLPLEETSILDDTLEEGKNYEYTIKTNCEYDEADIDYYPENKLRKVYKAKLSFYTYAPRIEYTTLLDKKCISPQAITLRYRIHNWKTFYENPDEAYYYYKTTGIEIFRGKSADSCHKIAEEMLDQKDSGKDSDTEYDVSKKYIDRSVETGEVYYYQVRTFAEIQGVRYYGEMTESARLPAVEPRGKYKIKLLTEKGEGASSLRLALMGKRGNDKLYMDGAALKNLVDYIYRKRDGSYGSMALKLSQYRREGEGWRSYRGEQLSISGKEKIELEFVAGDGVSQIPYPSGFLTEAELLFHINYNENRYNFHMDLMDKKAFMRVEWEDL